MWKRPQKHHHTKEYNFPVLLRYWKPKSVHGARRNRKITLKLKNHFKRHNFSQ